MKRPKDVTQNAKLVCDMLTGEVPNDKDEILNPPDAPEPQGRQRGGKARAEALTPNGVARSLSRARRRAGSGHEQPRCRRIPVGATRRTRASKHLRRGVNHGGGTGGTLDRDPDCGLPHGDPAVIMILGFWTLTRSHNKDMLDRMDSALSEVKRLAEKMERHTERLSRLEGREEGRAEANRYLR